MAKTNRLSSKRNAKSPKLRKKASNRLHHKRKPSPGRKTKDANTGQDPGLDSENNYQEIYSYDSEYDNYEYSMEYYKPALDGSYLRSLGSNRAIGPSFLRNFMKICPRPPSHCSPTNHQRPKPPKSPPKNPQNTNSDKENAPATIPPVPPQPQTSPAHKKKWSPAGETKTTASWKKFL